MRHFIIATTALGGILLLLLSLASENTTLFARNYPLLLGLNIAVAAGLLALVAWLVTQLLRDHRAAVFGSRLKLRLFAAFAALAGVAAQTAGDAQRISELGAAAVDVCGNLKFDVLPAPEKLALGARWREAIGPRAVWLAASTREGEEVLLLDAWRQINVPEALLVLVPLHYLYRIFRYGSPFPKLFLFLAAWIVGARVTTYGTPLRRDVFFISNHVSWVDILALAGASGTAFVAKAELGRVPVIGWLCRLNRTVFVSREDRGGVADQMLPSVKFVADKLVRRHPHVFKRDEGEPALETASQVKVRWEEVKAQERGGEARRAGGHRRPWCRTSRRLRSQGPAARRWLRPPT